MGLGVNESLMTDFDAWARLSAVLLRRNALDGARMIREAGVEHEWHRADAHWYGQLLQDVEAGRMDRIDRYRLLCVESLGARRRAGNAVESPLDALRRRDGSRGDDGGPFHATEPDTETARALAARWSVEDYAWLCAELERFPERAGEVWGARGITDSDSQRVVHGVWDGRLGGDNELRTRYDELLGTYRELLRRR